MRNAQRANLAIALFILAVIAVFGYAYNDSVTKAVTNAVYNDRTALREFNTQIIEQLTEADSTEDWSEIVEQYTDFVIMIQDSENRLVTRTEDRSWSALDVKVRTPFDYHNRAYLVISSTYLLRDYTANNRQLVKFFFIELLIGISAIGILIFVIYTFMLRPYRRFYFLMEDYENGKPLPERKLSGYVGKVYDRFVSMTHNLEREKQNQQRIIASISHDIKTPLTSVMGYTEQLQKGDLNETRQKQYLNTIYEKSVQMQSLIDEFDEYLNYNAQKAVSTKQVTTVQLCERLKIEFGDELSFAGIELHIQNNAPKAVVAIDPAKMRRVFGNIIGNSAKHVPQTGGKIEITIDADKSHVLIHICDNGDGVDEERAQLIFEPLYTSDTSRKVAGLGLAICKEIVEAHGGTIKASRAALGGLEILITLDKA